MFWQLCLHHGNTGEQKVYPPLLRYACVLGENAVRGSQKAHAAHGI